MEGNTTQSPQERLGKLYLSWCGHPASQVLPLPKAGSDRQYYRLLGPGGSAIGVIGTDLAENRAFLAFSTHFRAKGLPVPTIYAVEPGQEAYLQQDLGDSSLLGLLELRRREEAQFPDSIKAIYKAALTQLARMQVIGGQGLDYSLCFPRPDFDNQSIRWDLNYFKYYFLRAIKVPHDEQALEEDFASLAQWLCQADCSHFLFRDFQARNIMVVDEQPWFIDYQGGRRGAPQYDVASLLYQAKADLGPQLREELLDHYLQALKGLLPVQEQAFKEHYRGYVLIRCLQTLGSYGFRGFFERRPHFLDSIPYALDNLRELLQGPGLPIALPTLWQALRDILQAPALAGIGSRPSASAPLRLRVRSFSYKQGLPEDPSGNGGGFVFDCRAVHNPGRYEAYKPLTGRDASVREFLEAQAETHAFYAEASAMVEASLRRYLERGFTDLMVCFGCTGGQHRSVYFAERLAKEMGSRFPVDVDLLHVEQEKKNWIN